MLKMFNASMSSGAAGSPRTNASTTTAPLSPLNLLKAGVPAGEVIWFRRLKPDRQLAALQTTRGSLLLETVRAANGSAMATSLAA